MSTSTYPRPGTPFPHTHSLSYGASSSQTSYFSPRPLHFALPTLPTRTPPSLLNRSSSSTSTTYTLKRQESITKTKTHKRSFSTPNPTPVQTPELDLERRLSSSSHTSSSSTTDSAASPSLPQTPHLQTSTLPATYIESEPTPFDLPSPYPYSRQYPSSSASSSTADYFHSTEEFTQTQSKGFSLPEPEYNWTLKESITTPIFNPTSSSILSGSAEMVAPRAAKRPKLQRRDTPLPPDSTTQDLYAMSRSSTTIRTGGPLGGHRLTSVIDGGAWIVV